MLQKFKDLWKDHKKEIIVGWACWALLDGGYAALQKAFDIMYRRGRTDLFDEIYEQVKTPMHGAEVIDTWRRGEPRVMHLFSEESVDRFVEQAQNK